MGAVRQRGMRRRGRAAGGAPSEGGALRLRRALAAHPAGAPLLLPACLPARCRRTLTPYPCAGFQVVRQLYEFSDASTPVEDPDLSRLLLIGRRLDAAALAASLRHVGAFCVEEAT